MPLIDTLLFLLGGFLLLHFGMLPFLDGLYQRAMPSKKILLAGLIGAAKALKKVVLVGLITLFCFSVTLSIFSVNTYTVARLVQLAQWAHERLGSLKDTLDYFFAFLVIVFYVVFSYFNARKYANYDKELADLDQQTADIHEKIVKAQEKASRYELYKNLADLAAKRKRLMQIREVFLLGNTCFSKIFPKLKSGFQIVNLVSLSLLALSLIVIECTSNVSATAVYIEKIQISNLLKQVDLAYQAKLKELENVAFDRESRDKAVFLARSFTLALIKDPVWGLYTPNAKKHSSKYQHSSTVSDDMPTVSEEWFLTKKPEKFSQYVNVSDLNTAKSIKENTLSLQEEILANLNGFIMSNMDAHFFPKNLPHGVSEDIFRSMVKRVVDNGIDKVIKAIYNLKFKVFLLSLSNGHTVEQAKKEMRAVKHYISDEDRQFLQMEIKEILPELKPTFSRPDPLTPENKPDKERHPSYLPETPPRPEIPRLPEIPPPRPEIPRLPEIPPPRPEIPRLPRIPL